MYIRKSNSIKIDPCVTFANIDYQLELGPL